MTASCSAPVAWEDLVAYWAGDLDSDQTAGIDEHLMGCGTCSESSARVAAVTEAVRAMVPLFLSNERLAALRAQGARIVESLVLPTERTPTLFPLGADILLLRLGGIDLARAESVAITVSSEETGKVLFESPSIPFDPVAGEILVACQRHLGENPRTVLFEVRAREASGTTHVSHFAIPHVYEARAQP